jgi:hypothetical protein
MRTTAAGEYRTPTVSKAPPATITTAPPNMTQGAARGEAPDLPTVVMVVSWHPGSVCQKSNHELGAG